MRRGEIWWAELPEPNSSEPGFRRPVVVVQSDDFNRSVVATVVVVPCTTSLRLADAPGNVLLPRRASGLPRDSVANVSQLLAASKSALCERVGTLPASLLLEIDAGMRMVLTL